MWHGQRRVDQTIVHTCLYFSFAQNPRGYLDAE